MKKIATLFLIVIFSFTNICFSATSQIEKSRSTAEVIRFPSGSTGLELYNTADQTTNYEKFTIDWNANVLELANLFAGSASSRALRIGSASGAGNPMNTYFTVDPTAGAPFFNFTRSSGVVLHPFISTIGINPIASTGTQTILSLSPVVQQTSTAAYTILDVNPTETSTGSGTKLLQRWAVGNSAKAYLNNTGSFFLSSSATAGITFYNTADESTNYERLRMVWSGDTFYMGTYIGGTGTVRGMLFQIGGVSKFGIPSTGNIRYVPTSTQTLSAGTATTVDSTYLKVQGNGGAVTITATPSIADATDGDVITIVGQHATNTVTYQDQGTLPSSNLRLGAATRALGQRDSLTLMFDGTEWIETDFSNVV